MTNDLRVLIGEDKIETRESGKIVGGGIYRAEGAWQDIMAREQEVMHRSRQLNNLYRGASVSKSWRIKHLEACIGRRFAYNLVTHSLNAAEELRIDGLQRRLIRRWMKVEAIWVYDGKNHDHKLVNRRVSTKDVISKYRLKNWSMLVRKERIKIANKAIAAGPGLSEL